MGVEVMLSKMQCMWPWLLELGLLNAILSIFTPAEKYPDIPIAPTVNPWFYVNLVLNQVQVVLPVNDEILTVRRLVDLVCDLVRSCVHMRSW